MTKVAHRPQSSNLGVEGCIKKDCFVLLVNIAIDKDVVFTINSILTVLIDIYTYINIYMVEKITYLELS